MTTAKAKARASSSPATITAAGKEWTFKYSFNRLCELEIALGKPAGKIVQELGADASLISIRTMFATGMRDEEGKKPSDDEASAAIEAIGFAKAAELLGAEMGKALSG